MSDWYYLDQTNKVCGPISIEEMTRGKYKGYDDETRKLCRPPRAHGLRPATWERVAWTELAETCYVSTVFLGLDHSFRERHVPIVFETMAFWGVEYPHPPPDEPMEGELGQAAWTAWREMYELDKDTPHPVEWDCDRCSTWKQAERMHKAMVSKLAKALEESRKLVWNQIS